MVTLFSLLAVLCLYAINGLILPMTKTDGSLDISSLLSHIGMLEQSLENKASAADVVQLKDDLAKSKDDLKSTQMEVAVLKSQLSQCSCSSPGTQNSASASEVKTLQIDVGNLKQDVFQLQSLHNKASGFSTTGGSTFIRWGRTSCPANSTIVYKGYTGGTWYDDKGGSSSVVCLPEDPIYSARIANLQQSSHIYGSEFETSNNGYPFQHISNDDDIPCVVCESSRSSSIMIPGRDQCYQGWNLDYSGYLMAGYPDHASADYICVDSDARGVPGGKSDQNGQAFYIVESKCGSLPCPPYKNSWGLTCVVCSK